MDAFIPAAQAQTAGPAGQSNMIQIAMMVGLFGLMYLLLIRPQTKKAKEHRDMVAKLAVGDEVVTSGGVIGKITDLSEQYVTLQVATVGDKPVSLAVQRSAIQTLLPKGTMKSL